MSTAIILPFRSEYEAVEESLESIQAQKNALFDLYLVECGKSSSFKKEFLSPRIHYIPFLTEGRSSHIPIFGPVNKVLPTIRSDYVVVFTPGSRFLSPLSLAHCHEVLLAKKLPDFLFSAAWVQKRCDGWKQTPEFILRPERLRTLHRGLLPTAPDAIWIKRTLFKEVGFFSSSLEHDGVFDFVCRAATKKYVTYQRVFVEQNQPKKRLLEAFQAVLERLKVVYIHFGVRGLLGTLIGSGKVGDFITSFRKSPRFRGHR